MMTTLLQIRSNGQITLPAAVRRQANLKEGDTLELTIEEDGSLHLSPKIAIDRSQAYFWSKRWQAGEQAAQADIESGQTTRFDDIDDALEFLDNAEE
ncbi:MAG: AbrB/MazE/SpoVT family DNA-binding domain-containing protein [Anaerolineales bacterium]|nr:AbrB/MazE/SpoVT family DNA-binding domain-containing protein [Anaerolineales bacterium]MCA9929943.1 AbrB/MazE/SpoVT family DNA-binding domain-containing protein [Anaerolineales bacterium]